MKKQRVLLATLMTAVCALFGIAAVACNNGNNKDDVYSVTFNVQGHGTAPAAITDIASGSKIEKPTDPTDDDYDFGGWYKDAACEYVWNFEVDTVTSTRVLYALWTEKTYTVTFDVQDHGTAPAALTGVKKGAKVTEPEQPTEDGYAFVGWFTEAETANEWNFATDTVSGDITLYAKWLVLYSIPADHEELTFSLEDESVCIYAPATGNYTLVASVVGDKTLKSTAYTYADNGRGDRYTLTVDTAAKTVTYTRKAMMGETEETLCANAAYTEEDGTYTFTYTNNDETATVTFKVNDDDSLTVRDTLVIDYWTDEILTNTAKYSSSFTLNGQELISGTQTVNLTKGLYTITSAGKFAFALTFVNYTLPFQDAAEYVGEQSNTIKVDVYGTNVYVYFNNRSFTVTEYDEENDIYSFVVSEVQYGIKLDLAVNGSIQNIVLYTVGENGDWELADTLAKQLGYKDIAEELKVSASGTQHTQQLAAGYDFAVFNVSDLIGEWVAFEFEGELEFYWLNTNSGVKGTTYGLITATSGESVCLKNSYGYTYIAVKPASGATSVTFTVKEGTAPQGLDASNPIDITENIADNGVYELNNGTKGATYYLTYTPSQSGEFRISVYLDTSYTYKGTLYPDTAALPYSVDGGATQWIASVITLTAGTPIVIEVQTSIGDSYNNNTLTVSLEKTGGATYELEAGTYTYSDSGDGRFTLTITGDATNGFTASYENGSFEWNETNLAITNNNGVYSFSFIDDYNGEEVIITITVLQDGSLKVSNYNSYSATATFTKSGGDVEQLTPAELVAGTFTGNCSDMGVTFTLVFHIEGDVITVDYSDSNGDVNATGLAVTDLGDGNYSFEYEYRREPYTVEIFAGTDSNGNLILDINDSNYFYYTATLAN